MTVPVSDRLSQLYVGNGLNQRFDFTFRVFNQEAESGIVVRQKTAVEFVTLDPSLYTVTLNQDNLGGHINFITPPESNVYFYIAGATSLDQLLDITNYDNFYPDAIERALDKLTALLQEWGAQLDQEKQARILADIQYDALAMEREENLENRLISYINAVVGITNPAIFEGISDRMIVTEDGRTQREFNRSLPFWTGEYAAFKQETYLREEQILVYVNQQDQDISTGLASEVSRATTAEQNIQTQVDALGVGNKAYLTYADMDADKASIPANSKVTVTSDSDTTKRGDWQWNGTIFTKSPYDPLTQAKKYTDAKTVDSMQGVHGKNIFNINATDVAIGMYPSNVTGSLQPNASYNATGFIPIVAGQQYTTALKHFWCWYDSDKIFISGTSNTDFNITQTAPAGAAFMRASCPAASWSTFQVELGTTKTPFEPYGLFLNGSSIKDNTIATAKLMESSVSTSKLANGAVTPPKVSFLAQGKNLFNINDSEIALDKYVNSTNGSLASNTSYNATGYVSVNSATTYTISYSHMRAFYDANKVYISGATSGSSATFTPPLNAVYARFTVDKANWAGFQVEVGSVATAFEKYGFKLTSDVIIDQNSTYAPNLVLPPKIYALAGLQSHVYPEHLLAEDHKQYEHDITCSYGQQRIRGWEWDVPVGQAASITTLSWALFDKKQGTQVASASSTLVIANPSVSIAKKVCVIGDSLVNAAVITQRLLDISATDPMAVTLIGTRGSGANKHEGRGGWKISDYATVGRTYYQFTVSGVITPPTINSTTYTYGGGTFTVQETALTGGSGTISCELSSGVSPTNGSSGTLTKSNSVVGDSMITFSDVQAVAGNPFWNSSTSSIDFANYLTVSSQAVPDVVLIQLGVNDTFGYTTDAAVETFTTTGFANLDVLINSIKAANASIQVGIVAPPNYSNQDAFGTNYACGQTSWRARRNIVTFNKKLYEYYKNKEASNIYVIGSGVNVDTEHNVQMTTRPVNSQNSTVVTVQNNGVHPDVSGYKQIGDVLFAFLKAV